ncbi:MAG: helix-turn-helix domain-containing protein [Nocardioides sp.]
MTTQTTTQTDTQMSPQEDVHHRFEPVVTLAEIADYLHVPVQTLYDLRSKGRGPWGFRVGRRLQFRQSEVEAWLLGLESEDEPQISEQTQP